VGSGDLWNIMRGDKELSFPSASELIQKGFEYLQVLGTSNVLEKCFDCFALGLAQEHGLDWTTKVV
jgi:UDP-N-acetylglucosamine pyrophosphorylase